MVAPVRDPLGLEGGHLVRIRARVRVRVSARVRVRVRVSLEGSHQQRPPLLLRHPPRILLVLGKLSPRPLGFLEGLV